MADVHPGNAERERAAIEWHDSELVAVCDEPAGLVLELRAIVHRSRGEPAVDPGTVWVQPAAVVLSNGRRDGPAFALPADVADGRVETEHHVYDSVLPCPFASNGKGSLELVLSSGERLRVEADPLIATLTGDPEFLEDFVPDSRDEDGRA